MMSFLFGGFRDNNDDERSNTNYPSERNPPGSIFTRLCDYLVNNDHDGLHEEFEKNLRTMKCVDYTKINDKNGNNLLHMAVIYGCTEKVFENLIEKQNLDTMMFKTNNGGETPYRMAVRLNMREPLIYFEKNINNKMSSTLKQHQDILRRNNELRTMCDVAHEKSRLLSKELEKKRNKNIRTRTKRTRGSSDYDEEIDSNLNNELVNVKRRCTELERDYERSKNDIKLINETNDYLESENRKLQVKNKDQRVECDRLSNKVKMFETQNKEQRVECDRLSNKVKMFETQNKELALKTTKLATENGSLNITVKSLRKENSDLTNSNKKLKTQVDSFVNASRRK